MKHLQDLAKDPLDLTKNLTPERIQNMRAEALDMKLLYGTERVTEPTVEALWQMAQEKKVLHKMESMQKGEVVNFIKGAESEDRPALHTAMRDFFENPPKAPEATRLAREELEKLKKFYPHFAQFTDLVQIGIGGSSLGPQAICIGLEAFHKPGKRVHFISNVDPDESTKIFQSLDLKKTVVVVVSKSGSTLETVTNEAIARNKFDAAGLQSKNHVIAVTGKGSPMDDPQKYLASFYMWDYIGGRYSVTSMVGVVMLAFVLGIDAVMEFLQGAHEMDKVALSSDPKVNLPLISALLGIWNRNYLNLPTVAIIPYSQALARFPAHLQQLDMESNGKRIDKMGKAVDFETGPIIWGEPGTNGQHSFFQLIHQGTTTVPLEIIAFKETQYQEGDLEVQGTTSQEKLLSNLFAQSIALAQGEKSSNPNKFFPGNRPNRILLARRLDPFTIGAILAYYEHKVAFQGFLWNINSFDQEGVQLGKVLALKIINLFKEQGKFPLGEAYLKQL
jgi:glucose-6-phosphate isomerase